MLLLHAVYFILARFHNVPPFPYRYRDEKTRAKKPLAKLADKRMSLSVYFLFSRVCVTREHLSRLSRYIILVVLTNVYFLADYRSFDLTKKLTCVSSTNLFFTHNSLNR